MRDIQVDFEADLISLPPDQKTVLYNIIVDDDNNVELENGFEGSESDTPYGN